MYKKVFDNNGLEEKIVRHQVSQLIQLTRSSSDSPEKLIADDQSEELKTLIHKSGVDKWVFYSSASLFSMNIGAIIKDHNRMGRINLTSIVTKELNKVDPNLIRAIGNFRNFTADRDYSDEQHMANVGLWLVWNLMQRKPRREEYDLVSALGQLQVEQAKKVREALYYRGLN